MSLFNSTFEMPIVCDFTTILAHEIRNPLATIGLTLELMVLEREEDNMEFYVDIIKRSTNRINDLVNEMIKKNNIDEVPVFHQSVNHLLDEVVEMLKDRIMLKNIMVYKEYDPADCIVAINRPKMKIALTNIIVNAIEAMDSDMGELKLITLSQAGNCMVMIKDNGCGISEENLKSIFHANYTNKLGGMGVGLASTYQILIANNVKVHVESQQGLGTHFLLLFDEK